jgi:hypothetical protein
MPLCVTAYATFIPLSERGRPVYFLQFFSSTLLHASVLLPAIFSCGVSALFMYHGLRGRCEFSGAVHHMIQRCGNNFGLGDVDEIRERAEPFSDGFRETEAFDDRHGVFFGQSNASASAVKHETPDEKIGPDDVPASLSPSLSRSLSVPLFHQNITGLYGVTNSLWLLPRWRKTGVRIAAGAVRFIMPRLEVSWTVSNLEDTSLAREIHDALAVIRETIHASCPARMPQSLNRKMEGI